MDVSALYDLLVTVNEAVKVETFSDIEAFSNDASWICVPIAIGFGRNNVRFFYTFSDNQYYMSIRIETFDDMTYKGLNMILGDTGFRLKRIGHDWHVVGQEKTVAKFSYTEGNTFVDRIPIDRTKVSLMCGIVKMILSQKKFAGDFIHDVIIPSDKRKKVPLPHKKDESSAVSAGGVSLGNRTSRDDLIVDQNQAAGESLQYVADVPIVMPIPIPSKVLPDHGVDMRDERFLSPAKHASAASSSAIATSDASASAASVIEVAMMSDTHANKCSGAGVVSGNGSSDEDEVAEYLNLLLVD